MKNKTKQISLFLIALPLAVTLFFAGCKKSSQDVSQDPLAHYSAMLKNYQNASQNDSRLISYHTHAGTGSHDSCFVYLRGYRQCDSLFSSHFYEYCHTIYSNHSGNGEHHMGENGEWNHESGKCGLDSIHYGSGHHNFGDDDSLIYQKMQHYSMMGNLSGDALKCYTEMQNLRSNHDKYHNYH